MFDRAQLLLDRRGRVILVVVSKGRPTAKQARRSVREMALRLIALAYHYPSRRILP
jgi:hypothetical protein